MSKKILLLISLILVSFLVYYLIYLKIGNNPVKLNNENIINAQNVCGGWNPGGEINCSCSGKLIKPNECPKNAACDSGSYYCVGTCGECCYKGIGENSKYTKCADYRPGSKVDIEVDFRSDVSGDKVISLIDSFGLKTSSEKEQLVFFGIETSDTSRNSMENLYRNFEDKSLVKKCDLYSDSQTHANLHCRFIGNLSENDIKLQLNEYPEIGPAMLKKRIWYQSDFLNKFKVLVPVEKKQYWINRFKENAQVENAIEVPPIALP